MNNKLIIVCAMIIGLMSCTNPKKEGDGRVKANEKVNSEVLHKKIEKFHDEVMPEMSKLYTIEKLLGEKISNFKESESEGALEDLENKSSKVKEAQDHMMQWMRAFSKEYDENASEEIKIKKLQGELKKIEVINTEMKEALKIGESL